jgi:hypothetical protein
MTYRIKDYNRNLIVEHETFEEYDSYISSSVRENSELLFFQYDVDIYERIESGSLVDHYPSMELYRITYHPLQDDIDLDEE